MKNNILTKYLAVFLLICLVLDGILLCFCADDPWWNNWMITAPNLFMILGAFYCHLMKKNVDENPNKFTWLMVYKAIKLALTIILLVLYILSVKTGARAFILVTALAYIITLAAETCVFVHYFKNRNKGNEA
ncbi:MAG: hypothetical protein IKO23_05060 [Bacteroidales bacterium]|jgi:hypothetical protein|nr:hypothetical protein [Bacteroidales bacterium]